MPNHVCITVTSYAINVTIYDIEEGSQQVCSEVTYVNERSMCRERVGTLG